MKMGKDTNKSQIITIDGIEYKYEEFNDQQKILLEHVADLDRKLNSAKFSVDQLQVGRDAFFGLLKTALETVTDVTPKE
jgi:cell division septum initiation protein DivIVA